MNKHGIFALSLIAAALLAGCNTVPPNNALLDQARNDYRVAQDNPQARDMAGAEMKLAGDALGKANEAWNRGDKPADVDHLAYLAKQRIAIAQETGSRKAAEQAVSNADSARDKVRLAARTNEADTAHRQTAAAQRDSADAQRETEYAQARTRQLEAQLKSLNATKTARGMVITVGDVLFNTDKAQLNAGGVRDMAKLALFLKEYPQRKALIEGFTDSTGSDAHNQGLSARRADAVRTTLLEQGVVGERITTHGYGEAYPVAGNNNAAGRQLNRRVEIILSDDNGNIAPR